MPGPCLDDGSPWPGTGSAGVTNVVDGPDLNDIVVGSPAKYQTQTTPPATTEPETVGKVCIEVARVPVDAPLVGHPAEIAHPAEADHLDLVSTSVDAETETDSWWKNKLRDQTWAQRLSKYLLKGEWNERQWILRAAADSLHRRQLCYGRPTAFGGILSVVPPQSISDALLSHLRYLVTVPDVGRFLESVLGCIPGPEDLTKWYRVTVLRTEQWYSNWFISDYFRILFNVLRQQNSGRMSHYRLLSQDVGSRILLGDGRINLNGFRAKRANGLLFHELLRDTVEWRQMITVAPMLVNTHPGHFGTLVIYGEEKLVVWYDGSDGHLAARQLERVR